MAATGTQDGEVTRLIADGKESTGSSAPAGSTGILGQLQQLLGQLAAAPVTREVAAKAAELAALAAEKAGPAARSLAARTEVVGQSVAQRATTFASSMRADEAPRDDTPRESATTP